MENVVESLSKRREKTDGEWYNWKPNDDKGKYRELDDEEDDRDYDEDSW